ncbi:hypothetical protein GCM10008967_32290 [Bacillus carboniphilus]|uniref:Uncharacterized protein n=1 Tax=Bacillus carboniphilus TaxID=86663 RepID=A0ABN0WJ21_9BACI
MTGLGWIFWGSILFIIGVSYFLGKKGMKPPGKSDHQIESEEQARNSLDQYDTRWGE